MPLKRPPSIALSTDRILEALPVRTLLSKSPWWHHCYCIRSGGACNIQKFEKGRIPTYTKNRTHGLNRGLYCVYTWYGIVAWHDTARHGML